MKAKNYWVLGVLIIVCLLGWTSRGQSSKLSRPTWEYKIVARWDIGESDLNKLGADGWELAQYDSGTRGGGASASERYIFRRAK
jgi:hypothetical protein